MFEFQTLSSQIHRQGAVPTLNYRAVLGYEEEEGARGFFFKIIGCSSLKGFNVIV